MNAISLQMAHQLPIHSCFSPDNSLYHQQKTTLGVKFGSNRKVDDKFHRNHAQGRETNER